MQHIRQFMLAIAFGGIGSTIGLMVTKNVEAGAFDIMILHKGELRDFSRYAAIIQQDFSVQGYSYGIYTKPNRNTRRRTIPARTS